MGRDTPSLEMQSGKQAETISPSPVFFFSMDAKPFRLRGDESHNSRSRALVQWRATRTSRGPTRKRKIRVKSDRVSSNLERESAAARLCLGVPPRKKRGARRRPHAPGSGQVIIRKQCPPRSLAQSIKGVRRL